MAKNTVTKSKKRPASPPRVRAKVGLARLTGAKKLKVGEKYIASQALSPLGPKLGVQVAAVASAHDAVVARSREHSDLLAAVAVKEGEVRVAQASYDTSLEVYAHDAALVAGDDPNALSALGVDVVAPRSANQVGAPEAPAAPVVEPGPHTGSVKATLRKPKGASSVLLQFRLDAGPPDAWSDAEGTNKSSLLLEKLPPGALVRVRARAIGDGMSAWSEEGLGRVG